MVVICEICTHRLGTTTRDRLKLPLTSDMFDAPEAGYPPPFLDGADWLWMRCPMCGKRPFLQEDAVLTDEGLFELGVGDTLTEVERLKAEGLTNAEIGERLNITRQKVTAILRK